MAKTRPKYIAACNFQIGGDRFEEGDPVLDQRVIDMTVRHGSRFVRLNTKSRPSNTKPNTQPEAAPAEDTTDTED